MCLRGSKADMSPIERLLIECQANGAFRIMCVRFCIEFINSINDGQTSSRFTTQIAHKQPEWPLAAGQKWTLCSLEKIAQDRWESQNGQTSAYRSIAHAVTCLSLPSSSTRATSASSAPGTPRNPGNELMSTIIGPRSVTSKSTP